MEKQLAHSGLVFVLSQNIVKSSSTLPAYLGLANYQQGAIPFTLPAQMLLQHYNHIQKDMDSYSNVLTSFSGCPNTR
ncbi:hypothetical protein [Lysinibacillus sp. NPDC059133]|uniref:hypothetical protein n=1 Tax=Lysinibacillus sp. NPDC059133 TaxID=3346737 RepID=UPI0036B656A7